MLPTLGNKIKQPRWANTQKLTDSHSNYVINAGTTHQFGQMVLSNVVNDRLLSAAATSADVYRSHRMMVINAALHPT